MNRTLRLWRGLAVGGLSLALVGGVGLPISARASTDNSSTKTCTTMAEHAQGLRVMREKMLAQARAEDAALQKLIAELNKAPEAKKADLEAAILTKLVAEHHQRVSEWESLQARMMELRKEHTQTANAGMSGGATSKGITGQSTTTAKK
jgi:hypothetical protein